MRKSHMRGRGPNYPILDQVVQYDFEPGYVVFTMPAPKRLRVAVGDKIIADTVEGLLLHESDHLPVYYFPIADVAMDYLIANGKSTMCPYKGDTTYYSLEMIDRSVENIMWRYPDPIPQCPDIADYVGFEWGLVDHWYEEDEEIFVHARDPYRRIDCLPSSRRVEVFLGGEMVADSTKSVFLFETGLPTRYYLPLDDVTTGFLKESPSLTQCPYKGKARYYHAEVNGRWHEDIVWYYADPIHESSRIRGLVCFGQEFVDRIVVAGIEQPRPETSFSHGYR
jgi:uncharacterized protein (DUF427 family)